MLRSPKATEGSILVKHLGRSGDTQVFVNGKFCPAIRVYLPEGVLDTHDTAATTRIDIEVSEHLFTYLTEQRVPA